MWRARLVVTAVWVEGRSKSQVAHDDQVGQLLVVTGDLAEAEDVVQEAFARAPAAGRRCRAMTSPRLGCGGWN
jgi:predicted RNA polymerase sigma factor